MARSIAKHHRWAWLLLHAAGWTLLFLGQGERTRAAWARIVPYAASTHSLRSEIPFLLAQREAEAPRVQLPDDLPVTSDTDREAPAQKLPARMTICRGQDRCWSETDPGRCTEAGGHVFRTLPVDESDRLPAALRECQEGLP
jgi:hypothetical protein